MTLQFFLLYNISNSMLIVASTKVTTMASIVTFNVALLFNTSYNKSKNFF